ncbi:MAG TPA: hypothetical protein PLY70_14760 [Saprospiraceae bacterium]|nr:hypothetical protein [Saprospiraceae bacterium]HPN69964.1 hypothetical protein [Saprospiraceae bacterium]
MKNENLEKQIKNQLEQRSIKPSRDAWQKLESALDDQGIGGNKKGKSNIYYLLLFILLGAGLSFLMVKNDNGSVSEPLEKKEAVAPESYAENQTAKTDLTPAESMPIQESKTPDIKNQALREVELEPKAAKKVKKNSNASGVSQKPSSIVINELPSENKIGIEESVEAIANVQSELPSVEKASIDVKDLKLSISLEKRKPIQVSANKLLETAMKEEKSSFFSKVVSKLNKRSQEAITLLSERNLEN